MERKGTLAEGGKRRTPRKSSVAGRKRRDGGGDSEKKRKQKVAQERRGGKSRPLRGGHSSTKKVSKFRFTVKKGRGGGEEGVDERW